MLDNIWPAKVNKVCFHTAGSEGFTITVSIAFKEIMFVNNQVLILLVFEYLEC